MKRWPIRWKLTAWGSLVLALALSAFAMGVAYHLYTESIGDLDRALRKFGGHLLKAVSHQPIPWADVRPAEEVALASSVRILFRVTTDDGTILYRSPQFPPIDEPHAEMQPWTTSRQGRSFRVEDFRGDGLRVRAVAGLEEVDEVREDLLLSYAFALPLSLIIISFGGFWLSKRAMLPVSRLATKAESITASNLSERLPIPDTRDEVAQLTSVLNRMIDRLERSFRQARRFTADASHQLKTPLTIIRGEIEEILRQNTSHEAALVRVLDEVAGLSTMTDRLLLLSRGDADQLDLRRTVVDLSALLAELAEDFTALAEASTLTLTAKIPPDLRVQGDASLLRQLFVNLLENAIKYNRPHGLVSLVATRRQAFIAITIRNSGAGIDPVAQGRIFEPFHRADTEGAPTRGHGLGLNIAQELARVHRGTLHLVRSADGETEFCVELPANADR